MLSPPSLVVPFSAAALVLAASGVLKLRSPGPLVRLLRALGFPAGPVPVRWFGGLEVVLGAACLVAPTRGAALTMGTLYLCFAAVLGVVLVRGVDVPSCGCAGARDLPPSWIHLGLNLAASAASLAAASTGPAFEGVVRTAAGLPLGGAAFLIGVVAIAWLG